MLPSVVGHNRVARVVHGGDMTSYSLAEHVHACLANGHIVFLDIENDKYTALPPEVSKRLGTLVANRKVDAAAVEAGGPESRNALANLLARGMVQAGASRSAEVRSRPVGPPRRDLSEANIEGRRPLAFHHAANFLYAYARAVVGKKILGNNRVIRSLSRGRARIASARSPQHTLEELLEALRFIRIFFYREIDHCYFDCIVHMYFLRRYGFDPVWVFGVQMEPFHAHCWVQVGDVLVTNYLGETNMLHPILAV